MPFKNVVSEINLGQGGLNGSKNTTMLDPSELVIARNITYEGGVISKEGGAIHLNSTPVTGAIIGGYDWYPTPSIQRTILYTAAGYVYKDEPPGTFSTLSTFLFGSSVPVFVEGGQETLAASKLLFIFNGLNQVHVVSGDASSLSVISTPPADWTGAGVDTSPNCGANHEGRLWGALKHRAYYSTPGNHQDFTGSGSGQIAIFPGMGNRIIQMISFKGYLVIFKEPCGIFLIDTSDATPANWRVTAHNTSFGGVSSYGATLIDDDVIFLDPSGSVQLLSGVSLNNVTGSNLSQTREMNNFLRDNVNLAYLYLAKSVFYPAKREVHFALPGTNTTFNTARLVLDLNKSGVPRFRWSDRDTCPALWLRKDAFGTPRLTSGDTNGNVWLMDQEARNKDNVAYLGEFQTPQLDFGWVDPSIAPKQKLGAELEIIAEPRDGATLYCDVFWDGDFRHTISFDLNPQGVGLGEFILGTSPLGSGQLISIRRRKLLGSGRRLSLRFYNNEVNDDFAVGRAFVRFKVGNERIGHSLVA